MEALLSLFESACESDVVFCGLVSTFPLSSEVMFVCMKCGDQVCCQHEDSLHHRKQTDV